MLTTNNIYNKNKNKKYYKFKRPMFSANYDSELLAQNYL